LPLHYSYERSGEEGSIYSFTTNKGISYMIAFTEDEHLNMLSGEVINNVYSLSIIRDECDKPGTDPLIQETINIIVRDFFSQTNRCVLFICDDSDNKHVSRYKTFCKWYQESEYKNEINKFDNLIPEEDKLIYTSIMFHHEFPNREQVLELFSNIEVLFKEFKNTG
jgi:hypothetical protein